MLFNSVQFLVFFTGMVFLYFSLPHRARLWLLLAGSYYFYMCWRMEYILLILISTVIDYLAGIRIDATDSKRVKRGWLAASLVSNLGLLFFFKYYNFFSDSARALFQLFNITVDFPLFDILLPVGISFYTFQTLAYTLDVYFGTRKAEKSFWVVALYVAYFPQLVAGPIERSTNLMPQLTRRVTFDYDRVVSGFRLMLWGYFKKMMIADRLAMVVNPVYTDPAVASPAQLLVATVCFSFQIYCDFSAYSDIAIGSSRILGIDLMQNFRQPYLSKSVSEFWRRWHISLSTWFRDYLYIPLGGSQASKFRASVNLVIVFLVSGLWHGANWTFVIWGGLHAVYMLVERWMGWTSRDAGLGFATKVYRWAWTYALVTLAWVFFRAEHTADAWIALTAMIGRVDEVFSGMNFLLRDRAALLGVGLCGLLMALEAGHQCYRIGERFAHAPMLVRWAVYYAAIFAILLFGVISGEQFIYFQF